MITSTGSYRPHDYAHNRPYPTAASREREHVPYLGTPEDQIRSAFIDTYTALHSVMQTQGFAQNLEHAIAESKVAGGMGVIDEMAEFAEWQFHNEAVRVFTPVVAAGHADGIITVVAPTPLQKSALYARVRRRPRSPWRDRMHLPRGSRSRDSAPLRHIEAARDMTGRLVTYITENQRTKISNLLKESISRGIEVEQTAKRISNVVGLFPRWQQAVDNLYQRMIDNGIDPDIALRRARDYWADLVDTRSEMIARTELMRALNLGRLNGWRQLDQAGRLDGDLSMKTWQAATDACDECLDLDGVTVTGIETLFPSDWGGIAMPPGHPHCRCTVVMTPVDANDVPDDELGQAATDLSNPELADLLAAA